MNNILFITRYFGEMMGGTMCSKRNYSSLQKIFDKTYEYRIMNKVSHRQIFSRIEQIIFGYMGGIDELDKKNIKRIILEKQCSHVFIDSSLLGYLSLYLHQQFPSLIITCFFHNFEYHYIKETYTGIKKILYSQWTLKNENLACKYSNHIIALNQRDALMIQQQYKRKPDICIPISIPDTYTTELKKSPLKKEKYILFIGSYFPPNVEGILWFIQNVLPHINIKLVIVGKDMDKLHIPSEIKDKIHLYSNVPDLSVFYQNAELMVMPIFSGSGMKVKTAEALMYGKFLIGTKEAFEGYEIDEKIGILCNNANDFIKNINKYSQQNLIYNAPSRTLFIDKYSSDATQELFNSLLK